MKKVLLIFLFLLSLSHLMAQTEPDLSPEEKAKREKNIQAGNPFKRFGYTPKIATLSKGKYLEFHDLDSVVRIGSFSYHVKNREIVGYTAYDTLYPESTLRPELMSRWISPDPLSEEFPSWSPYNFVYNNPIRMVDPKGLAAEDWVKKNGKWIYKEEIKSAEQAKKAGYDDYSNGNDEKSVVTTAEGKEIKLRSNGTWDYIPPAVGMGAVDGAIMILAGEAAFNYLVKGTKALWALRSTSKATTEVAATTVTNTLVPLGLGSTGRTVANNLVEQTAMKSIIENPTMGKVVIEGMKDTRWLGWSKMQYTVKTEQGVQAVIHYVGKWENGILKAVDDFKFAK